MDPHFNAIKKLVTDKFTNQTADLYVFEPLAQIERLRDNLKPRGCFVDPDFEIPTEADDLERSRVSESNSENEDFKTPGRFGAIGE